MQQYITTFLLSLLLLGQNVIAQTDEPQQDTTSITLKNKKIIIISKSTPADDTTELNVEVEVEDDSREYKDEKKRRFKVIYNFGMNGYLSADNQISLPAKYSDFELDYARSRSFGFSFMMKGFDLFHQRMYISPGIGFSWNNYTLKDNQLTLSTQNDTVVFMADTSFSYDKYKLRTTYIEVPLIIGFRLGDLEKRYVSINAGVIGGYNIGTITKEKYSVNGTKHNNKISDDYNVFPFKLDLTASISLGRIGLFGRYSLTHLLEQDKAPVLYPFAIGLRIGKI